MAILATALVTGASRGIGRAIACRLSRDGFRVAINDLPSQKSQLEEVHAHITEQGGKVLTAFADVSVEKEVNQMVESVVEQTGGLDVVRADSLLILIPSSLLGNARWSLMRGYVFLRQVSLTPQRRMYSACSLNALSTFLCYKYAAQQMIKQGRGGRIIGASSLAGKTAWPMLTGYSSSKFAVRGLTQNAALDLGKYGITVNAYGPGPVDTPMMQALNESVMRLKTPEEIAALLARQTSPIGTDAAPEDIAGLVSYLASKESRLVTGQTISINGGLHFD